MMFTKRLREGVRDGSITCSVRIWTRPHVRVGGIYPMEEGHILLESIRPIAIGDITGELARRSEARSSFSLSCTTRRRGMTWRRRRLSSI